MTHVKTAVAGLREIADGYFEMTFDWPPFLEPPVPGQFFTVRPSASTVPLLRRPFAFSAFSGEKAGFIFERRGEGTQILAGKRPGDTLDVLGPLGNCFPEPAPGRRPILIAGGIGVGPIYYYAASLAARGFRPLMVVGARSADSLASPTIMGRVDAVSTTYDALVETVICTDDGSVGFCGTPIDYLARQDEDSNCEFFLCGPHGLLAAGHFLANEWGVPAWVSMEQTMGCAVGACMGCAVRVHGDRQYARVCTEGPIFESKEIVWT